MLERVQGSGAYADLLLHAALARSTLSGPDRAFATELVYGTLRWRGRIDYYLAHCLNGKLEDLEPLVASALRLGGYQLLCTERVPPTAAVDESVRCVRAAGSERATGLVNAVLRRLAREHAEITPPSLEEDPLGHLVHALSLPAWIAERWLELFGPEQASLLAEASNAPPPLVVRVNPLHASREELLAELRERFPDARLCAFARHGIELGRRGNAALDRAFLEGRFSIQDEGSQLVVDLLDPQPGESALDVCAAPGGKATALAERVGSEGRVLALDRNPRRLELVVRAARRLELPQLACQERDASLPLESLRGDTGFQRVLVDVPCSGLGTLRRNPDARWRLREEEPARLATTQCALLSSAATALGPGGALVYSTCTLLPEENEQVVEAFLATHPGFARVPRSKLPENVRPLCDTAGDLRCLPHLHDTDGFYAARLEKEP
ncbi:MAG: 16S rRNA (cytosine(967)-C(5))-methyltransferase RsmB [Myxococcales bacterium]|nr:16S rRNA (cytosine(967)-C(5))-methyltransferase RsmB [Myxococcales bacterium]